jgi:hypothetical protein
VLLGSTVGFAILYIAAALTLGTTPDANDNGATVARWFRNNGGHVRTWMWLITLLLPLIAVVASFVRGHLPSPYGDIFFFGAVALAAETAVQGWLWAGMAWHANTLAPATARTLLDVASYWGPVLTSATIAMLAPVAILGWRRQAGLPRWLGALAALALIEQAVETITVFGRRGFIAPGGPMNLYLGGALTGIALVSVGITISRSMPD